MVKIRWGYKTVHFAMKKEGLLGGAFLDETEIEQELNDFGKSGWELVTILETHDGVIAIFKQPLGGTSPLAGRRMAPESQVDSPDLQEETEVAVEDVVAEPLGERRGQKRQTEEPGNIIGAIRIE